MKTFDAIVGDVTILANRSDKVEFTQPYAESGLSMIVPAKYKESAWMFMKPFTKEMWLVTGAVLIYTMFIVWFLEHHTNPEFNGPWKNQIGTALWFTFSSLYFAHSKLLSRNSKTRIVYCAIHTSVLSVHQRKCISSSFGSCISYCMRHYNQSLTLYSYGRENS